MINAPPTCIVSKKLRSSKKCRMQRKTLCLVLFPGSSILSCVPRKQRLTRSLTEPRDRQQQPVLEADLLYRLLYLSDHVSAGCPIILAGPVHLSYYSGSGNNYGTPCTSSFSSGLVFFCLNYERDNETSSYKMIQHISWLPTHSINCMSKGFIMVSNQQSLLNDKEFFKFLMVFQDFIYGCQTTVIHAQ